MKTQFLPILLLLFCSLTYAQNVEIPDTDFLNALIDEGVDTNADNLISFAEAEAISELNVSEQGISDLTGIEAFINLDTLDCSYNQLTNLDVSNNTALTRLSCGNNQLTSLDVSNNAGLIELICDENQLSSLDVSNNIALEGLECFHNSLTSLNVSNNINLTGLECRGNKISTLDVSNNTALSGLNCSDNELKELNISNNSNLRYLWCFDNQITNLDVSNNKALEHMFCSNNQISSLDVSENTSLFFLFCGSNQLSSLDLTNNLELFSGFYHANVFIDNMPSLKQVCIPENIELCCYDTTGSPNVYFTTECNVNIPDTAFLHALIGNGVDTNNDSLISYAEAEAVGFLNVSGSEENPGNISDMTGIEAFVNLEELYCWYNKITTLDMSNNLALRSLLCFNNLITSLDVSSNLNLSGGSLHGVGLDCSNNQLTSLNVTNNTALLKLLCFNNKLTNLDISNNPVLIMLYCSDNNLTELDISNNAILEYIELGNMPTLVEVCVWWESTTPPDTINIDTTGSPNVYFTTDCSATGIIENNSNTISIYPNPVKNVFNIEIGNTSNIKIEIYSINGILLFKKELNSNSEVIDISNYNNGIYIIKIIDDKAFYSRRLIVRH